jgi:hypothetical protein
MARNTSTSVERSHPSAPGGNRSVTATIADRTGALLRGLLVVIRHHGAEKTICDCLDQQLHRYLDDSSSESVWVKRAKHALTFPIARFLRNEEPPQPDKIWHPSAKFGRWAAPRLRFFNRRNIHLWYSWLQCKRAALPMSQDIVEETYVKHKRTLTAEDVGDDETIEEIFDQEEFRSVLDLVRERVMEAIDRVGPGDADVDLGSSPDRVRYDRWSPSNNSCFESVKLTGGQRGYLVRRFGVECWLADRELISMTHLHRSALTHFGTHVVENRGSIYGLMAWHQMCWSGDYDDFLHLPCMIQAVLEPMKVRVISKGPGVPYYRAKELQKALHGALRSMPQFRLIGRWLCPTDLMDLDRQRLEGDSWVSVDYSAATDGLSAKYSSRIFEHVIRDLPEFYKYHCRRVIGMHDLWYPSQEGRTCLAVARRGGVQMSGQLMGSPLSFPILCLANFGLITLVLKRSGRSVVDNSMLINGDDAIYPGTKEMFDLHKVLGRNVGLEMSPGKAYVHKSYLNINSVSLVHPRGQTPWQIDFLNTGLVFGQHKVMGDSENGTLLGDALRYNPVAANLDEILKGSLPGRQCDLMKEVLRLRAEDIHAETAVQIRSGRVFRTVHRNLFLPISSGGMGVTAPTGWKYRITDVDHQLAHAARLEVKDSSPSQHQMLEDYSESREVYRCEARKAELEVPVVRVQQPVIYHKKSKLRVPSFHVLELGSHAVASAPVWRFGAYAQVLSGTRVLTGMVQNVSTDGSGAWIGPISL